MAAIRGDPNTLYLKITPRSTIPGISELQQLTNAGLNLEGVRRVLELEAEIKRLKIELERLREEAKEAIERTHRQYRRDLVPVKQSPIPYRR